MTDISSEIQKSVTSNLVTLFQLDATGVGGDVYNFIPANSTQDFLTPVLFGGVEYYGVVCKAEGFELRAEGSLPTPTLKVTNTNKVFQAAVISLNGLIGAKLTRIRTFEKFLDTGATPDPDAILPLDIYFINRKVNQTKTEIEWELSSILDQQDAKLPARRVLRNYCPHTYRKFNADTGEFDYTEVTCPYTGTACFNRYNDSTTVKADDQCNKKLSGCRARFGTTAVLPIQAFPGVGLVRYE